MVKLIAPFSSAHAAGSLANLLTFYRTPHGHAVHRKTTPPDPKTDLQRGLREMIRALTSDWALLSTAAKLTWTDLADDDSINPYHAFLKHNMQRWRRFKPPTQAWPATETGVTPDGIFWTLQPSKAAVRHLIKIIPLLQSWTYEVHRKLGGDVTPAITNTTRIQLIHTPDWYTWTESDLPPGTYYYRARLCSNSGKHLYTRGPKTATVT